MKKSIRLLLLACISMLLLVGCGDEDKALGEEKKLEVYYLKGHDYYGTALGEFNRLYGSAYPIKITAFETDEELQNQLTTEIAAGKGPDVVLISAESGFDIYKAVKSGNIEELTPYFANDNSFQADDYYSSVMECTSEWGGQYIVPFTFNLEVLFVEEAQLKEIGYEVEGINNFTDFVNMIEEFKKNGAAERLSLYTLSHGRSANSLMGRFLINSGLKIVDEQGNISEDLEDTQTIMKLLSVLEEDYASKPDVLSRQSDISFDKTICLSSNGNYPILQLMAQSIAGTILDTEYIALPWKNMGGTYQPSVCDYGFVNRNSSQKEAAYILLKYLMDYEIPFGLQYPISVSRKVVDSELSMLDHTEMFALRRTDGSNIYTEFLDESTREEIEAVLDNMGIAVLYNTGYHSIVEAKLSDYMGTKDMASTLDAAYDELNRYLRE